MENQQFINLFFGVGLTVMGWFARELWAAVKDLKTDLAKLRENLPKEYLQKMTTKRTYEKSSRC
jgi:hypothetical protein